MRRILFFVLAATMMLGGTVQETHAAAEIFLRKLMYGGALPDTPGSIHLEADHYGRTLGRNNPCTYHFYVVDRFTGYTVVTPDSYNKKTVTMPSNGGRLVMDLDILLPEGRYFIYFEWASTGMYFWDFVIGNPPPLPVPIAVSSFYLTDSWLSKVDDAEPSYLKSKAYVYRDNTIVVYPREWHSNLTDAEATVTLTEAGHVFLNGNPVSGSGAEYTFRADFSKPVTLTVVADNIANDDSEVKEYTVTVNNPNGSIASLNGVRFIVNGEAVGETMHSWGSSVFTVALPAGMPGEIGDSEFGIEVSSNVNASIAINERPVDCELRYYDGIYNSYSYLGVLDGFTLNEAHTIKVTSPDGSVTKEYTVQIIEVEISQDPPVSIDEQYMQYIECFAYSDDEYRYPIEDAIPIQWLRKVAIRLLPGEIENPDSPFSAIPPGGHAQIMLKSEEMFQHHSVADCYPQDLHENPEIYFRDIPVEMITPGRYDVVLMLEPTEPTDENPYPQQQEYVLGSITLTDEEPAFYGVNTGTFAGGSVSVSRETSTAGKLIDVWFSPLPEYEVQSFSITGEGGEPLFLTVTSTGRYDEARSFIMPSCDVTITATFREMTDDSAVEKAAAAIASGTGLAGIGDTQDPAGMKELLAHQVNSRVRSSGITVTADDIEINEIVQPVSSKDGSYTYTVRLTKGNAVSDATGKGIIYSNTVYYSIIYGRFTGGYVSPSVQRTVASTTVTLEVNAYSYDGYELDKVAVHKAGDESVAVTLEGTGNIRTFTMPAYTVTVTATFRLTEEKQAQADEEVIGAAKDDIEAVEEGTYHITQVTGNTLEEIRSWLRQTLGILFAEKHNIELKLRSSEETPIMGELDVTYFVPAIAGTAETPAGTNGSFHFILSLSRGDIIMSTEATGTIIAVPYTEPPVVEPVIYSIQASAGEHGSITPSGTVTAAEGNNVVFTFTPDEGYEIAEIKVDNQVVDATSGNSYTFTAISANHSITVTFRLKEPPTGNTEVESGLKVWAHNGRLYVSGLTAGEIWNVYGMNGVLLYHGKAAGSEASIPLPGSGVCIVKTGNSVVKIAVPN